MTNEKRVWCAVLMTVAGFQPALGFAESILDEIHLVNTLPNRVFIPPGFDDNDNAQVVLKGNYPNTCFKTAPATAQVDRVAKKIVIQNQAYYNQSCWCLFVLVPYVQSVDIGILEAGSYSLFLEDKQKNLHPAGTLPVAIGTGPGQDDFLYAPIEDAFVNPTTSGAPSPRTLTLTGTFTSDCMSIKEVRTFYRAQNVIEVLPMLDIKSGVACKDTSVPFQRVVKLNVPWSGSTLIHVRSMNGKAINKVVEF